MKKQRFRNIVMVAVILGIAIAGILSVGYIQGWFDQNNGEAAVLSEVRGIVTMERNGVAYGAQENTVLRQGDRLTAASGANAVLSVGGCYLTIGDAAQVEILDASAERFTVNVAGGEVFAYADGTINLQFEGYEIPFINTVASVSVRSGAQSISVYAGSVSCRNQLVQSGQTLHFLDGECTLSVCRLSALNDFLIGQLRAANEKQALCFSVSDLDRLLEERQASMQALLSEPSQPAASTETETTVESSAPEESSAPSESAGTQAPQTEPTQDATASSTPPQSEPPATETAGTDASVEPKSTCILSIRCDTILSNMDDLEPGKAEFVPSDGIILYPVTVEFSEGETVFDVLKRVCEAYGIQLEYSWTPMYDSYYIEGINHLYEFDCGSESGWMFKVNGWFPNYGCSSYTLKDGDIIVWCYTCNGFGADVGGSTW